MILETNQHLGMVRSMLALACRPRSRCTVLLPLAVGDAAVSNLEQHLASLIPTAAAAGGGSPGDPQNTLSAAMQRRIHHNIQLAARCARLEAQKQALEAESAELSTKLDKAQVGQGRRRVPQVQHLLTDSWVAYTCIGL